MVFLLEVIVEFWELFSYLKEKGELFIGINW